MRPLALDDEMLDRLTDAAALLPAAQRGHFMRSVANRINHLPEPGIADLETAIQFVLNTRGVSAPRRAFFTSNSPDKARARAERQFRTTGVSK